ncbi:MAG: nucleotidyl transferase AbiEii/AbiGii toxin family protein [Candidatus Melainabacteria bacterium]|nr:MAG: nucleotidyl transferase AbiEii/AbiGii toxin family protein [Candidatus Melainabacteria bacterium]
MNPATDSMLRKYNCVTRQDFENAMKEIIQEIALLGLWRAKFFEHAAFYGGTALRILYGLDRFSEDMDFSLLVPDRDFELQPYLDAIGAELSAMDFNVEIAEKIKNIDTAIDSAFIKADTKEHFLKIDVPREIADQIAPRNVLKIKLEVDTNPPGDFETEAKVLLQPIPFSVRTYKQPDLFAGKIHALLERGWGSGRVKGRDYYDFVWYLGRDTPVHLAHLKQRLCQTRSWNADRDLTRADLVNLLESKFSQVDIELAKRDVLPFVKDPQSVDLWTTDFFISLLPRLKVC